MELGKDQQKALKLIKDFLSKSSEQHFSLTGPAGSGKSFLLEQIVNYARRELHLEVKLCAPTHKAAAVMREYTGSKDVATLHSVLGLKPNLDVKELDVKELEFVREGLTKDAPPRHGLLVVDEASMINDDVFDYLSDLCRFLDCKILFISDKKQLAPVKSERLSKVYDLKCNFELKKIYRQSKGSAVSPLLKKLRKEPLEKYPKQMKADAGSLYVFTASVFNRMIDFVIEKFKECAEKKDAELFKILSYTNARVSFFNQSIHNKIYPDSKYFGEGEIVTMYENGCGQDGRTFYNSEDFIVKSMKPTRISLAQGSLMIDGFQLTISRGDDEDDIVEIDYVKPDQNLLPVAVYLDGLHQDAVRETNKKARARKFAIYSEEASKFISSIDLFVDGRVVKRKGIDYGYAVTTHKSQGSTYNEVLIDWFDYFKVREKEELRQLQYVGLSRTRTNAYLLCDDRCR